MGKHQMYARRGTATAQAVSLPLPPAPQLTDEGPLLVSFATGDNDAGGRHLLYYSESEEGSYSFNDARAWSPICSWGAIVNFNNGWYKVTEEGNGVAYAGESLPSAPYHIEN